MEIVIINDEHPNTPDDCEAIIQLIVFYHIIMCEGSSYWGEPHSNIENNTVIHTRRTTVKNRIATPYIATAVL